MGSQVKNWLIAFRVKTLTAALVPVLVGTAIAYTQSQQLRWEFSGLALLSALLIQIATNLINDALDFKKGADQEDRLGPARVTQKGIFTANQVYGAGIFCFLLSAVVAIPLVVQGGWPIVWIGVFSILAGYAYTGGPYPLAYHGWGDFFVLLFFGWVAVLGMVFVLLGKLLPEAFLAGTQIGLLATVLIAINNFRDHVQDKRAGKKTLAVRFGPRFARFEIRFLCFFPFVLSSYWLWREKMPAFFLPLLVLPFAISIAKGVSGTLVGKPFNRLLARSAALHLLFGLLLTAGLLLSN